MLPDAEPIDVTPLAGAPARARHVRRRPALGTVLGLVVLVAVVGGVTVLAQRPTGPDGAQKLADRLVDLGGRTTSISMSLDPDTGAQVVFLAPTARVSDGPSPCTGTPPARTTTPGGSI